MSKVASLRPGLSVDSEAVQAGVFWMTPVGQHPHLDDLESLIVLLLCVKNRFRAFHQTNFMFKQLKKASLVTITGKVCSDSPSSWYV